MRGASFSQIDFNGIMLPVLPFFTEIKSTAKRPITPFFDKTSATLSPYSPISMEYSSRAGKLAPRKTCPLSPPTNWSWVEMTLQSPSGLIRHCTEGDVFNFSFHKGFNNSTHVLELEHKIFITQIPGYNFQLLLQVVGNPAFASSDSPISAKENTAFPSPEKPSFIFTTARRSEGC